MKKILAISVIFALVAGAAFAQPNLASNVETRWLMAAGDFEDDSKVINGGGIHAGAIRLDGTTDDGTLTGLLQLTVGNDEYASETINGTWSSTGYNFFFERAFVMWSPIEQISFFLGKEGDGLFNTAQLTRWGYHQMPRGISEESWDADQYLIGNWDGTGWALMLKPIEGLAINFAMDLPRVAENEPLEDSFKEGIQVQLAYDIENIGTVSFTYNNMVGRYWMESEDGIIGLTFLSYSLVPGLALEAGGSFELDVDDPIRVGFGFHYTGGEGNWGVKHRTAMHFVEDANFMRFDIMPWYNFGWATFYGDIRIVYQGDLTDAEFGWHFNPYIRKDFDGGSQFRLGAYIGTSRASEASDLNADGDRPVQWGLATVFLFQF